MARIDESRPFLPVSIAVLTVSDTRTAETDTSGNTLAARIEAAGHRVVERAIERDEADRIRDLVERLRKRDLRVFGVQNAPGLDGGLLADLGLIPVSTGRDAPIAREPAPAPVAAAPAPQRPAENKVIRSPVRSGQMVVADQGDLTVIGSVASGAELIAAGNIHVYGTLRGRAMAGCHGNENAHIFCQSLDAELVAIAGLYQTSETLDQAARDRCTHIYLENEKLRMEVIA